MTEIQKLQKQIKEKTNEYYLLKEKLAATIEKDTIDLDEVNSIIADMRHIIERLPNP